MKDIPQRKQMAMGGSPIPAQSFGVPSFNGPGMVHPDAAMKTGATMGDGARGHTPPVAAGSRHMHKPGVVDHGPHNHPPKGAMMGDY